MKKIVISILASFVLFSGTAFASKFNPADVFLNYGGGIEKGDMITKVSVGMPWSSFDAFNHGGWAVPSILGSFEVAVPIGRVPFSFGGYLGLDLKAYNPYYGGGYWDEYGYWHPDNRYYEGYYAPYSKNYTHFIMRFGGSASYHVNIPVRGLDVYLGTKLGMAVDISDYYKNNVHLSLDWGLNIGASYFFNDTIGVNLDLGYPYGSVGVIFKL